MGNTEMRGKVIWFLLTCRPDLLPVDLKRQGRAEEHIALFYPDTDEERAAMLRAMQKKSGTELSAEVEQYFADRSEGLSGADIEAVLMRTRMRSALEPDHPPSAWRTSRPRWTISFRRHIPPRSNCRTWWRCWSAPA